VRLVVECPVLTFTLLEDFLKEEGVLEETRAVALKETLAWQVQQAMKKDKISKVEMARRMNTSRAALDLRRSRGFARSYSPKVTHASWGTGVRRFEAAPPGSPRLEELPQRHTTPGAPLASSGDIT